MPKFSDRLILDIIIVLSTLMWTTYLFRNAVIVAVVTVAVYLLLKIFYLFLYNRYRNVKTINVGEMEFLFSVMTQDEQAKFFLKTLPESAVYFKENNYFCISLEGKKTIVFCVYKFLPVSYEDIAKAYRTARDKEIAEVAFLGRTPNRQTMLITRRLNLNAHFIPGYRLKRFLTKHNALPTPIKKQTLKRERLHIRALVGEVFHPRRAKYFAVSGIVLGVMSIFTPLKLYYLILSSVTLTIAAVSIIMKRFYN